MANFSKRQINHCWNKAPKRSDVDSTGNNKRVGAAGALIKKNDYGKQTNCGWTIDHKKPTSLSGTNEDSNLRAMHWKNNNAKGDNYKYNNEEVVYERVWVYKQHLECNDNSNTGMTFTDNEAKDE